MKTINRLFLMLALCSAFLLYSCANDNDPIDDTEQTTDDTTDPTDDSGNDDTDDGTLNFSGTRINVTLDVCEAFFCSVTQLLFLDDNIGYAVTGVWIYKTTDGGETWNTLLNQDITGKMFALSEQDLFINTFDGILYSTNGGGSWANIERPLEFECENGNINPGIMFIPDTNTALVLDKCERLELYKTDDLGGIWNLILESTVEIIDYYFEDENNGLVVTAEGLQVTTDGGATWNSTETIPPGFDYVLDSGDAFEFADGISVAKPDTITDTSIVWQFDVNDEGEIAVIFFDEAAPVAEQWTLMLYLSETSEWFYVDQLADPVTENPNSTYSTIFLTESKTMFIGISFTGDVLKYSVD